MFLYISVYYIELEKKISKLKDTLHCKKVSELVSPDYKIPPEMLENFIVFVEEHHSKWFDLQWQKQMSCLALTDGSITFNYIYESVWKPVISKCLLFLNGLYNKSLPLCDIKMLDTQNLVVKQLEQLCSAMQNCYKAKVSFCSSNKWITEVIKHINVYKRFISKSEHINALKFCLKLKESLQMKGDFKDITDTGRCVSIS